MTKHAGLTIRLRDVTYSIQTWYSVTTLQHLVTHVESNNTRVAKIGHVDFLLLQITLLHLAAFSARFYTATYRD